MSEEYTKTSSTSIPPSPEGLTKQKPSRVHYLDWLQVLAILGVFLFHAVHPFDDLFPWHIKNAEPSIAANFFIGFFGIWGMPFFFLMAGATSWFSLRRRSAGRYARERVTRLLIPFVVGAILLTPIQAYFELTHHGWWEADSFLSFLFSPEARSFFFTNIHPIEFGPTIFGALGYHLWFVGFLFAFSLLALPIFLWLKRDSGKQTLDSLARLASTRGGLLLFVIPPVLARFILQPFFPGQHDWSEFVYMMLFFVSGYIIISDKRFTDAIRRDWVLYLALGIGSTLFFFSTAAGVPINDWLGLPGTPGFYISWLMFTLNGWCWTMVVFYIGMRFLDRTDKSLRYSRSASYPIFMIHQPIILFVAFFVVQWQVGLSIKVLVVIVGSFVLALGAYEFLVRRINPVRALFGMKPRQSREKASEVAA